VSLHRIVAEDVRAIAAADLPYERLAESQVLVTGAAGFLGTYLVEGLIGIAATRAPGLRVIGLVRNLQKARARFEHHAQNPTLQLIEGDVCDAFAPEQRIGFIVHAASPATPARYGIDPVGTLLPNTRGTHNLLELARRDGSVFLFVSAGEAYGALAPDQIPTPETVHGAVDSTNVRSCYAESKRLGETLCVAYHHQHQVAAKIARLFHTYGPGLAFDDGRVFADFVADIVRGRDLTLKSDGSARRTFCYVADAITGLLCVLLEGAPGQAYNVGSMAPEVSVLELAERLVALFPTKKLSVRRSDAPAAPGYLKSPHARICPDTRKLQALGWKPQHSIESGFRRTVESYA
jgi:nucleoside-diphosphate-sugar epimerase